MKDCESKSELSDKERLFCRYYMATWNSREAALRAGYSLFPERNGTRLLAKKEIKNEISRLYKSDSSFKLAGIQAGYERLAFSSISDAIKLVFTKDLDINDIDKMDLFNISEIKRSKDGALEIKFFDRFKALDKLRELENYKKEEVPPFYKALMESAKSLNGGD